MEGGEIWYCFKMHNRIPPPKGPHQPHENSPATTPAPKHLPAVAPRDVFAGKAAAAKEPAPSPSLASRLWGAASAAASVVASVVGAVAGAATSKGAKEREVKDAGAKAARVAAEHRAGRFTALERIDAALTTDGPYPADHPIRWRDEHGNSVLHLAVDRGHPVEEIRRLVQAMIRAGMNPNAANHAGQTPVQRAATRRAGFDKWLEGEIKHGTAAPAVASANGAASGAAASGPRGDLLLDLPDSVVKLTLGLTDEDTRVKAAVHRAQIAGDTMSVEKAVGVLDSPKEKAAARKLLHDMEIDRRQLEAHRKALEDPSTAADAFVRFAGVAKTLFANMREGALIHPEYLRELLRLSGREGERYSRTNKSMGEAAQVLLELAQRFEFEASGNFTFRENLLARSPSVFLALAEAGAITSYVPVGDSSGYSKEEVGRWDRHNLALFHAGLDLNFNPYLRRARTPDEVSGLRNNILTTACAAGDLEAVKNLVKQRANLRAVPQDAIDPNAMSVLEFIASQHVPIAPETFRRFLEHAIEHSPARIPEIAAMATEQGTPLDQDVLMDMLVRAAQKKPSAIPLVTAAGAVYDHIPSDRLGGWKSPVSYLAKKGDVAAIEALFQQRLKEYRSGVASIRVQASADLGNMLSEVPEASQDHMLSVMEKSGFNFNPAVGAIDLRILESPWIFPNPGLFMKIVKLGANPNSRDRWGRTVLDFIRMHAPDQIAPIEKALAEYNESLSDKKSAASRTGITPLDADPAPDPKAKALAATVRINDATRSLADALRRGEITVERIQELAKRGANLQYRDREDNSLLHLAIDFSPDIMRVLLSAGVAPSINRANRTPLDLVEAALTSARKAGRKEDVTRLSQIAEMLRR